MGQLALDALGAMWHFRSMEKFTDLLNRIEAFAAARGVAPATVVRNATKNPRLYDRLKRREETLRNDIDRIEQYLADPSPVVGG